MIRRTLTAAAALAAMLMLDGASQAATSITRQCIRQERSVLVACRRKCTDDFRSAQAACFGPGSVCAGQCQTANLACLKGPDDILDVCLNGDLDAQPPTTGCRQLLDAKLEICRLNDPNPDTCANKARLEDLQCRLACTDAVDELRFTCTSQFQDCLASCASCRTPTDCPQ